MGFKLPKKKQVQDYLIPFDYDADGFNSDWWFGRAGTIMDGDHTDYVTLLLDDVEVARAEITPWELSDSYLHLSGQRTVYEIWFFEVRESCRAQGIGRKFAEMLTAEYSPTELIAFSEKADEFWSAIGWTKCPRKDGDPHYRPLFVNSVW